MLRVSRVADELLVLSTASVGTLSGPVPPENDFVAQAARGYGHRALRVDMILVFHDNHVP